MNSSIALNTPDLDEIVALAFHLYLKNGCPEGAEWECWREAEQTLKRRDSKRSAEKPERMAPLPGGTVAALAADVRRQMLSVKKSFVAPFAPASPADPAEAV